MPNPKARGMEIYMKKWKILNKCMLCVLCLIVTFSLSGVVTAAANTYSLLLIGVDRRDTSWNGNSDVMLLLTVNDNTETIYATSFLRDLYADIPGVGVQKLNASCANGGAELTVRTIESNYGVKIDNYAMVDFNTMKDIVDYIGGVDLDVSEDEIQVENGYIQDMCNTNGEDAAPYLYTYSGFQHVNGYQALAHCRNRYSGNENDFGRTARQREVLQAILDQMLNVNGMGNLVMDVPYVLSLISHDISSLKMMNLIAKVPTWINYDLEELHIPFDGEYYSENEILIPYDMEDTIYQLTSTIYAE